MSKLVALAAVAAVPGLLLASHLATARAPSDPSIAAPRPAIVATAASTWSDPPARRPVVAPMPAPIPEPMPAVSAVPAQVPAAAPIASPVVRSASKPRTRKVARAVRTPAPVLVAALAPAPAVTLAPAPPARSASIDPVTDILKGIGVLD